MHLGTHKLQNRLDCDEMKRDRKVYATRDPYIAKQMLLKRRQICAARDPEIIKQTLSNRRQKYWNTDPAQVAQELSKRRKIYANKDYEVDEQALLNDKSMQIEIL